MDKWKQLRIADVGFKFKIKVSERKVSYTIQTVTLNGETFDLPDLYEALSEVQGGDTYIWEDRMCKHLLKLEVLKSCGSRRVGAAYPGHRFNELFKQIEELYSDKIDG